MNSFGVNKAASWSLLQDARIWINTCVSEPVIGKASTVLKCPSLEIFKFIGDDFFQNYPKWSPEVKELKQITSGPLKLGSIAQQTRIDFGRCIENSFKVFSYERSRRLGFTGLTDPFRCIYDLESMSSGEFTKLTFTFELIELLPVMRSFETLVRSSIKNGSERTVQNIKHLIEKASN